MTENGSKNKAMNLTYNPHAIKNEDCKACQENWPIHTDHNGGNRHHIDIIMGITEPCPTQDWPDYDTEYDDEEIAENEKFNDGG